MHYLFFKNVRGSIPLILEPGKVELYIAENLLINNQGILEIKDEIITVINNYKIYLPLL